jgi:hypothetical protein
MELQKFGFKLFTEGPTNAPLVEFIPLFHRWIQSHSVEGLLIDVADYSHVAAGPGIVLIGHEGNYSIDEAGGRRGLLYLRKQPLPGGLEERLARAMAITLAACRELERTVAGGLRFRTDEIAFFANDRSTAPNDDTTWRAVEPALSALCKRLFPETSTSFRREADSRERFGVLLEAPHAPDVASLLDRLPG